MPKPRRPKRPVLDITIRKQPVDPRLVWSLAESLIGQRVVVWLPLESRWKRGYLLAVSPGDDLFRVKWRRKGFGRNMKGLWRVHPASLFSKSNLLPEPLERAMLPVRIKQPPKEGVMATRKTTTATKKPAAKKKASTEDATPKTRVDKLAGLTEAKRRNIAKLIYRERGKSPATSWPDVIELIEGKYDWTLPGSMTGRRLLREYGPDGAEDAIIKQERGESPNPKAGTAKKAATKKKAKKVVEEEPEDDEEEDEEELEDEEDEDEDEDEEEEEEPVKPAKKRVRVQRGKGKKTNPS